MRWLIVTGLGLVLAAGGGAGADAATLYTVADLGTLGSGYSDALAINDSGHVVGESATADGRFHAFLSPGGPMVDLGTLGGDDSVAYAVGGSGQVAGEAVTAAGDPRAFLIDGGPMVDLGTLGGTTSVAFGINDSGQVVGEAETAGGEFHAFFHAGGPLVDLGTLGGSASVAYGINDSAQVVGQSETADWEYHAFVSDGGPLQDLGTLGGSFSLANAINNSGQVVGEAETADWQSHAFLYTGGPLEDLGTLGGGFSSAFAVNELGQVVGQSETGGGAYHGFVYDARSGMMTDLNDLVHAGTTWTISAARGINETGQIAASGSAGAQHHALLLTPVRTLTWDGQGDGLWHSTTQWTGGAAGEVPGDATRAEVHTDTVSVAADGSAASLLVRNGGRLAVEPGKTLSVVTDVEVSGGELQIAAGGVVDAAGAVILHAEAEYVAEVDGPQNGRITAVRDVLPGGRLTLSALQKLRPAPPLAPQWYGDETRTIVEVTGGGSVLGTFDQEPPTAPDNPDSTNRGQGHIGRGVFLTHHGPNGRGVTYGAQTVEVDLFQAADGDTNGDRYLNGLDIQGILAADTFATGRAADWTTGDFDGNGLCDPLDIQAILATALWDPTGADPYAALDPGKDPGKGPGSMAVAKGRAVPEPSTLGMLAAAAIGLSACGRRGLRRRGRPTPQP